MKVEVALVATFNPADDIDSEATRPYREREKATLSVEGATSLRSILDQSMTEFLKSHTFDPRDAGKSLDFYRGSPDEGAQLFYPARTDLTIVDSHGHARWHVKPEDITLDQLTEARRSGVINGDVQRPYLIVDPKWQMGGYMAEGWTAFVATWTTLLWLRDSRDLAKAIYRRGAEAVELYQSACEHWRRSKEAAEYAKGLFLARNGDVSDVIATTEEFVALHIADLMAWTGIDDPAVAAGIAGWSGKAINPSSGKVENLEPLALHILVKEFPMWLNTFEIERSDPGEVLLALEEFVVQQLPERLASRDLDH